MTASEQQREAMEPLPCPFCGDEAEEQQRPNGLHYVECTGCPAQVFNRERAEAIAAWNRRALPPAVSLLLRQAAEKLELLASQAFFLKDCVSARELAAALRSAHGERVT
jgi:Lar family restriction alleviation protein